jgi:hypothetical protein
MRRSETGLNVPLNQRPSGGPPPAQPDEARPCWVYVGAGEPLPGTVHAWQRDPATGLWRALVAVWLPSDAISPRDL